MPERFEILTAGFYLFVQAKRRPWAFVWLVFWSIIAVVAIAAGFYFLLAPLGTAEFTAEQAPPDEMMQLFAFIPLLMLGVLIFCLVFSAGWNRFLVGNRLPALIPFRLWADEGRFFVIGIVHWALMTGAYFVAMIPMMLITGVVIGALAASGVDSESGALPLLAPLLIYPLILFGALAFSVKFLPAYPMTIREKRIVIFDSWNATKGVFWSAFVAALIPQLILIGLQIVFFAVQITAIRISGDVGLAAEAAPVFDMANAGQVASYAAALLVVAILWILLLVMSYGPFAYIANWHDRNRQYREPQMAPLEPPASE